MGIYRSKQTLRLNVYINLNGWLSMYLWWKGPFLRD